MDNGRSPDTNLHTASSYQAYLPALLQADPLIGQFLLAFEQVLTGLDPSHPTDPNPGVIAADAGEPVGLEQVISLIHTYFNPFDAKATEEKRSPQQAPAEFLPWLSSWVALSLRDDWEAETKRRFINEIVPLYQKRGTKEVLETILKIYLESAGFQQVSQKAQIVEFETVPHFFTVELTLPDPDPTLYRRQVRIAKAIIDQEKPAHTFYALKIRVPTMQIRGKGYALSLKGAGVLGARIENLTVTPVDAKIQQPGADGILALKIKGGALQQDLYAQAIASTSAALQVSWSVTADAAQETGLKVSVANLSSNRVTGTLVITYPDANTVLQREAFTLAAGLRFPKRSGRNLLTDSGNTVLGTTTAQPT
jgi:phage tail-like protein